MTTREHSLSGLGGEIFEGYPAPTLAGTVRDITMRRAEQDQLRAAMADLQMALGRVRTLSGLLPMCAWCKRIRNDEGYWAQIESYISADSEAKVSHGICPDCFSRMWKDE